MELKSNECVGKCDWKPAEAEGKPVEREGQPIFECGGCGSEWAPTEEWTPKNADGVISPRVAAARMQASQQAQDAETAGQSQDAETAGQSQDAETAGQTQNDSADDQAAPAAGEPTDIPPVIEAKADGVEAPANDSADNVAAPLKGDAGDAAGGGRLGSW